MLADTVHAAVVELPEKYRERTPSFSADGTVKLGVLQRGGVLSMAGSASNQEVARKLMTEFPDLFAGFNDALGRVGSVARRLGVD